MRAGAPFVPQGRAPQLWRSRATPQADINAMADEFSAGLRADKEAALVRRAAAASIA